MRILIVSGALHGHVNTMLPLALAACRQGHQVVVATGADLAPHVQRHGLAVWPVGPTHAEAGGSRQASWLTYFQATAQRRLADLVPLALAWRPDIVLHEETELAGPIVAGLTRARHVVHGLGLMPSVRIFSVLASAVETLGRAWGLAAAASALADAHYLHICPPALQPAGERVWTRVLALRPAAGMPAAGETLPAAVDALPHAQTIHLTLGTVFQDNVAVLRTAVNALRTLPLNLIVTAGPGADPGALGPQPGHVLVERYLPHALLLPRCRLVVSQGGAGILFGALGHGLPQLVLPQGADQFGNADACRQAGAGLSLVGAEASASAIAVAARRLLDEPAFEHAARAVQAEIETMPDADAVFARLAATEVG